MTSLHSNSRKARTQDGPPVCAPRVRRGACPLQLQLPRLSVRTAYVTQTDGAPISELTSPAAELDVRRSRPRGRLHAVQLCVAAEHASQGEVRPHLGLVESKQPSDLAEWATNLGAVVAVGRTRLKQAPGTCRVPGPTSGSPGARRPSC